MEGLKWALRHMFSLQKRPTPESYLFVPDVTSPNKIGLITNIDAVFACENANESYLI